MKQTSEQNITREMEMNKQTVFSQGGRGIQGNEGEAASQGT